MQTIRPQVSSGLLLVHCHDSGEDDADDEDNGDDSKKDDHDG